MVVLSVRVVTGGLVETGVPVVTAGVMVETVEAMVATVGVTTGVRVETGVLVVTGEGMTGVPEVIGVPLGTEVQMTGDRVIRFSDFYSVRKVLTGLALAARRAL
jgi:hypothetical protein